MAESPINVAAHLARMAAADPDRPALLLPERRVRAHGYTPHRAVTFAQLAADTDALAHGLVAVGVTRGTRAALMVPPSADFFALTFALLKVAAVPVLIDPGMGVKNLGVCLAEAEPAAFVGIPKAHLARRLLRWARKSVRVTVNVGRGRFFCDTGVSRLRAAGAGKGPYPLPDVARDEPAAVLFTSGSTGIAKGAVYTHGVFAAQVELLRAVYGLSPGEVDFCTFPLFALFGPALGMTCVVPDMDFARPARIDPRKAVAQVAQFGATNLFGSPAVVRALGSHGARLPSLRRAISAGAPARADQLERIARLLAPGAEVFTPYGATEALPVANIGSGEILTETRHLTDRGKGVCIGRPVPGVTVRIIPITDDAIPEWDDARVLSPGEVGELAVCGPVVTAGYFGRPEATRLAKIRDPRTGALWHRMGDVGYYDDTGRLWFCGRKSHRVVTPHGTLFTDMVEPVFNTVKGVYRTALVGVTRDGVTHPVLCVERWTVRHFLARFPGRKADFAPPRPWEWLEAELRTDAALCEHTRAGVTFLEYAGSFPVDVRHNSKIFREKLAAWADRKLGPAWRPTT
ncbi:MAG TPA: fatty acid CoA ligase family protein [Urbifossiella sp.]|nr:fatty acid CoA ligase family protein [Urbifossiella sp.]